MLSALQDYGHIEIDQCLENAVPLFDKGWPWSQWNVSEVEPYRPASSPIASVTDGDPREVVGHIYPIGNEEFYVPDSVWTERGTESRKIDERLAQAERVVRPQISAERIENFKRFSSPELVASTDFRTRQLFEFTERSRDIPPPTLGTLKALILEWEKPRAPKARTAARPS